MREPGYYWVKYTHEWLIAEWYDNEWTLFNAYGKLDDVHFDEIDENRIVRPSQKLPIPPSPPERWTKEAKYGDPPTHISDNPYICNNPDL
jgi:hypothetical protein